MIIGARQIPQFPWCLVIHVLILNSVLADLVKAEAIRMKANRLETDSQQHSVGKNHKHFP